jgi:hypothetical protein
VPIVAKTRKIAAILTADILGYSLLAERMHVVAAPRLRSDPIDPAIDARKRRPSGICPPGPIKRLEVNGRNV